MIKERLKKNEVFMMIYRKIRNTAFVPIAVFAPTLLSRYRFRTILKQKYDKKNPKTFNQKIMKIKLENYNNNNRVIQCADKYRVRQYLFNKNCSEILNPLIAVYKSADDINWEMLPNQFVIKCNHGCGYNIVCANKDEINERRVKKKLKNWMGLSCGAESAELHYMKIKRCIVVEKYISSSSGKFPLDYRFYCTYGKVKTCLVMHYSDSGYENHISYHIFVDNDYNVIDVADSYKEAHMLPPKPKCFEKMKKYASILSEDFPFVRVDLYDNDGEVVFGELTFTPVGCLGDYNESDVLDELFYDLKA